jgi:hypothetical protein
MFPGRNGRNDWNEVVNHEDHEGHEDYQKIIIGYAPLFTPLPAGHIQRIWFLYKLELQLHLPSGW